MKLFSEYANAHGTHQLLSTRLLIDCSIFVSRNYQVRERETQNILVAASHRHIS
jgi:hypothetical protein